LFIGDGGGGYTDNGRDWLGDDLPPDELNHAPVQGLHFGFPYCHGGTIPDPEFTDRSCAEFEKPALQLGPHVAALGMRFYTGEMFPEYYRNGIFIAEHGSWNRKDPIGYRVMFVKLENNMPVSYEVFAEGWLQGTLSWGRPVDVEVMNDGSLLISDDKAGKIYRVSYEK
jgi:glucose/arabinose dehydrogenase